MNGVNGRAGALPQHLQALEAMLFVAEGPAELAELARGLDLSTAAVRGLLDQLDTTLAGRGIQLQRHGARAQLVTAPEAGAAIERFLGGRNEQRLSHAALETLAIVAYKQPISRPQIEAIRGVDCARALATLRARELVEEIGRADGPGRPLLFGTTMRFLEHFGLQHPGDLPPLPASLPAEPEAGP